MWWPPYHSWPGFINAAIFLLLSASTFYNFLYSLHVGPGYLPLNWKPVKNSFAFIIDVFLRLTLNISCSFRPMKRMLSSYSTAQYAKDSKHQDLITVENVSLEI
jgi:hypothetical protein